MTLNADGSINLMVGSVDLSATRTSFAQITAKELGIDPSEVPVTTGDTDSVAHTDGSGGSRITYTMGAAVYQACRDVLTQLMARAAERPGVTTEVVEYKDRVFFAQDIPGKTVPLVDLAVASVRRGGAIMGKGSATKMQNATAFATHVADVEVDPETGKVKLLSYTTFKDAGLAVNSTQVEGQMQGGTVQGIGGALTEGYQFDSQGVLLNASLLDYRMPTALDLPMIGTEIVEVPASDGPYSVHGVGEVPIVPPPAAVANAIADATGTRLQELLMNPEAVFWTTKKAANK